MIVVVVVVVAAVALALSQILFSSRYIVNSYSRETARSLILFRLTFCVIRKIMPKIGFFGHPMRHQEQYMRFI